MRGIDFIGPFMSSYVVKYILVATDYVLKWVKAVELSNNDEKTVTSFLMRNIFSRSSKPRSIIRDGVITFVIIGLRTFLKNLI